MNVLLFNPPTRHGETVIRDNIFGCFTKSKANYVWPAINLALLGSILKKVGAKPKIVDAVAVKRSFNEILEELYKFKPDAVVIVTGSATFDTDCKILKKLKKHFSDLKTVMIGNHVTCFPEKALKNTALDYIILGEPEMTFQELFDRLVKGVSIEDLKGLAFMRNGTYVNTGVSDRIEDLDILPFADRDLIPDAEYLNPFVKKLPYTTMNTSRGCPFPCIYCAAGMTYGKRYRARTAKNVVDEIQMCVEKYGIKEVFFRDEEFTIDKRRVEDICNILLERNINIGWICNARIDSLDDKTLELMAKAGCHLLKIGVESGSDKMLKVMKKGIKVDQIKKTFKIIKKYKIGTVAHFIIGLPGENEETLRETKNLIFEIDPDYMSLNIAMPYPGTELFDMFKQKLTGSKMSDFDIEKGFVKAGMTHNFCDLSPEYLEDFYYSTHKKFYFRPKFLFRKLCSISSFSEFFRYVKAGFGFVFFTGKR